MQDLHLFSNMCMLPGISSVIGGLLKKLCGGDRIIDLLLHIPQSYLDRRSELSEDSVGKIVTFIGIVKCHGFVGGRNKSQYKVILETNVGEIVLIFFNYSLKYLKRYFKCRISLCCEWNLSEILWMFANYASRLHYKRYK